MNKPKLKSIREWEKISGNAGLSWQEYCDVGDYVTENVFDYFLNILPPAAVSDSYLQVGEPHSHCYNPFTGHYEPTFLTLAKNEAGYWVYCGNCFLRGYRDITRIKAYQSVAEILKMNVFEKNRRCQVRLHCKDGFSIHISAGEEFYCSPRENRKDGAYQTVEGGLPNQCEELLLPYAEEPDLPTETVYAYVPIEIMDKVIQNHGWLLI